MPESLFNKVANVESATLFKNKLRHRRFLVNFAKFQRTTILLNICKRLLLDSTHHAAVVIGYCGHGLSLSKKANTWSKLLIKALDHCGRCKAEYIHLFIYFVYSLVYQFSLYLNLFIYRFCKFSLFLRFNVWFFRILRILIFVRSRNITVLKKCLIELSYDMWHSIQRTLKVFLTLSMLIAIFGIQLQPL